MSTLNSQVRTPFSWLFSLGHSGHKGLGHFGRREHGEHRERLKKQSPRTSCSLWLKLFLVLRLAACVFTLAGFRQFVSTGHGKSGSLPCVSFFRNSSDSPYRVPETVPQVPAVSRNRRDGPLVPESLRNSQARRFRNATFPRA